ncbi:MAG: MFS transporter, partial [Dehalococcoidia bacterium]|nr:MFS transporter [Dehalococcoidia bacterium]
MTGPKPEPPLSGPAGPPDSSIIRRVFPVLALVTAASALGTSIVVPFMPLYATTLGATGIWVGLVLAGFSIAQTVVMPFIGHWSDRYGRRLFLLVGLGGYALLSLVYIWVADPLQLVMVRLAHGFASGLVLPVARAWVGDVTPRGQEGTWQGYYNTAWFGGMGAGPFLGGLLAEWFSLAAVFIVMSALSGLAFLVVVVWLKEGGPGRGTAQRGLPIRGIARSGVFTGVFSLRVLETTARQSFFSFLPIFAAAVLGLNVFQIGVLFSVNLAVTTVFQVPAGKLGDRTDRRLLIFWASLVGIVYM